MADVRKNVQLDVEKAGKDIRDKDKTQLSATWRRGTMIAGTILLIIWFLIMLGVWRSSPDGMMRTVDNATTSEPASPEDQAKRVLMAQQQAEIAAAAQVAAETARKAAEKPLEQAVGEACGGRYKNLKNCESVAFERDGLKYDAEPDVGFCSAADPISGVTRTELAGGQQRYIPKYLGVRVRFFELKEGDTFAGFTCK